MHKRIIEPDQPNARPRAGDWLPLEAIADIEITSESRAHPIEAALMPGDALGWRAATPGEQLIRLLFREPTPVRRIVLKFVEREAERTQEYVLRYSSDGGQSYREIVRQQWNFSPNGSTEELEDHHVELPAVTTLELRIVPDKSGGRAIASLAHLRVA